MRECEEFPHPSLLSLFYFNFFLGDAVVPQFLSKVNVDLFFFFFFFSDSITSKYADQPGTKPSAPTPSEWKKSFFFFFIYLKMHIVDFLFF